MQAAESTLREYLMNRCRPEPAGCWLWTGSTNKGYGQMGVPVKFFADLSRATKVQGAHRVAYEAFVGPVPSGMDVMHRCDVRACINPDHLKAGTRLANLVDMSRKGRGRKRATTTTGVGVRQRGNHYEAYGMLLHRYRYFGMHSTEAEAAAAAQCGIEAARAALGVGEIWS